MMIDVEVDLTCMVMDTLTAMIMADGIKTVAMYQRHLLISTASPL